MNKLVLSKNATIEEFIYLGFGETGKNWELAKKVYTGDEEDNKNFYRVNFKTRELYCSLQSNYFDDTIYELIKKGLVGDSNE